MAILAFQKPEKVIMLESTPNFGKFEFRPLEPGFGMTIGNALRRILLSSLEGYAITTVKVAGVDHEFAAIPGVMEGMIDIILNLKQVRFIRTVDNMEAEKVSINVAGVTELTAGYISNFLSYFKVLNPDLVICRLSPGTKMQMDLTIGKGRGYVPAEENAPEDAEFGVLPIDSIHTPIKNVKYSIENYRVEQKTDYEKLNLEITTDGSIHPKDALKEAAKILIQHFMLFSDEKITLNMEDNSGAEEFDDGDEGCDGGAFEEIQDFVGHHGESEGECLRKDDVLHGAVGGKAYDLGGFDLSFGDGVEGGVKDFRKVGSGVEAKSDDGIGEWRDLGDEGEICLTADHEEDHRQSVEDDVKDDECRYGASEKDIGLGDTLQDGDAVDAGKGCPKSQHNRKKEREEEKFQRRRKVGENLKCHFLHLVKVQHISSLRIAE